MAFSKILSCVYSIVSVLSLSILSLFPQYYQHVELYFSCFLIGQKTTLCFLWNFRLTLERRVTHPLSFSCTHYVRIETQLIQLQPCFPSDTRLYHFFVFINKKRTNLLIKARRYCTTRQNERSYGKYLYYEIYRFHQSNFIEISWYEYDKKPAAENIRSLVKNAK